MGSKHTLWAYQNALLVRHMSSMEHPFFEGDGGRERTLKWCVYGGRLNEGKTGPTIKKEKNMRGCKHITLLCNPLVEVWTRVFSRE